MLSCAHSRLILLAAPVLLLAATPAIVFENIAARSEKHQIETMISGLAIFDYNNGGLMDLYFVNGARLPGMDKSDPRFKGAGFGMGVAATDYDNDGWVDLYVTGIRCPARRL